MVPDHSPEEASPPEPLSGGRALPSELSVSDQSQSSSGRGPILEGPFGGWRDVCCTECPSSKSSSELNGGVLSRRGRNEASMDQKHFKSQTSPPASVFGLPQASPAPSLGPGDSQESSWSMAATPATLLEDGDPTLPVQQLRLKEETGKERVGLSWLGAKDPGLFVRAWEGPHLRLASVC